MRHLWSTARHQGQSCMGFNQVSVRVITKPVNIGHYGLRDRNESGDLLADLCVVNELVVSNNTFQQHPRRLYTSISPGDRLRN